jgi:hypothetical protein
MEIETLAALPKTGQWEGKAYVLGEGCEITISGNCFTTKLATETKYSINS